MAYALSPAEPGVMAEMNTTPLIDVMLVLLIMFIITIPVQSHAVKLDLPQGPPPDLTVLEPLRNKIVITSQSEILWNGQPVDRRTLGYYLSASQQLAPVPELQLQPEPSAPYALVDEVLAATKRAGVEKMGFVGNEAYGRF